MTNSVAQVNPIVVKKICPIDVTLNKPTPKKVGNRTFTTKIKTKKLLLRLAQARGAVPATGNHHCR